MKLLVNRNQLIEGINTVEKFIPSKTPVSFLSGIKFLANENFIYLTATDMDMGIEYKFPGNVIEEGEAVLTAKVFSEIIRKLSADEVELSFKDDKVNILTDNFKMVMPYIDATDFPNIGYKTDTPTIEMAQPEFKNMIKQVIYARAEDSPSRPQLTGALLEYRDNMLHMVALDGFRIAWKKEQIDAQDFSVIIPGKTLIEVSRIFSDSSDETFKMYFEKNNVIFKTENTVISSRILEGKFIDYEKVIDMEPKTSITINTSSLSSAIDRAHVLAREGSKNNLIIFNITSDGLEVKAETEIGSLSDKLECKVEGEALTIAFNARFFIDALRPISTEMIRLEFNKETGPCIIKPFDDENYINFILPVKLRSDI